MFISNILTENFRNLKKIDIELNNGINIFYGNNAQGKTNIIESIYICATGRSHRTKIDNRLINFDKKECHIRIFCNKNNMDNRVDLHIKKDEKKGIAINGFVVKKIGDLFGTIITVIFSPEDLSIIKNSPSEKRRFLDIELCQINNIYYYNLKQYYKILKQRNTLLKEIKKDSSLKETIFIWDNQLLEYGKKIILARKDFIYKLNKIAFIKHKKITGGNENLILEYKPDCTIDVFKQKLLKNIEKDIFYGNTHFGPHKDDIIFKINNNDVKLFGSQGQQRTVALSLKLAEIDLIESEIGEKPIVLLDDVFSELDGLRQKFLIEAITDTQVIITCTGIEDILNTYIKNSYIFYVENGNIINKKVDF